MIKNTIHIRWQGQQAYDACWQAMRTFTDQRDDHTIDEIWLVEHPPVFTLGQNGKTEHILIANDDIPIVNSDRGGQVTYHGPGQLMLYTLIDIKRRKMTIRDFVCCLEKAVISFLKTQGIAAYGKRDAPGVYINHNQVEKKICSIGLRVRRGATYHGLAFNVAMDLSPFDRINPCGFSGLKITQLVTESPTAERDLKAVGLKLSTELTQQLGYTTSLLD